MWKMVQQTYFEGKDQQKMNWKNQIVYQIFVDRFKRGPNFAKRAARGVYLRDGGILRDWDEIPSKNAHCMEFFGGDLEGIVESLDYISSLNVNVIYLTPIFSAATNHKYDTHDFTVDEQFGGEDALKNLISEAHKRGISILLDGVFNHVGADGKWFNRSGKYVNLGAYNSQDSEFRDFFKFKKWPDLYDCWYDVKELPELNLNNEKLREILFESSDSVLKRYLRMGIDGWRLDCAHDLDHQILKLINENAKSVKENALIIGEVSTYPYEWLKDDEMDGVMNYYFREIILKALKGDIPPSVLKAELDRMVREIGVEKLSISWNILSSHDTIRLKSYLNDVHLEKMAIAFQITYVGNPLIYYGEENGMEGFEDPDNRRPMVWERKKWDMEIRKYYEQAIRIKSTERALHGGEYVELPISHSSPLVGFLRHTFNPYETLLFFANISSHREEAEIPVPFSYFLSHSPIVSILGKGEAEAHISSVKVSLPPYDATIFKFVPRFKRYKMYKYISNG